VAATTTAAPVTTTTTTTPPTTTTVATTTTTATLEVTEKQYATIEAVMAACNAQDTEALLALLADADIDVEVTFGSSESKEMLIRNLGYHYAVGTTWSLGECEAGPTPTRVSCSGTANDPLREAFGLGALDREMGFDIEPDGTVTQFTSKWTEVHNGALMDAWGNDFQPFYEWIEQNHPGDLAVMLTQAHRRPRTEETSLKLWAEYVPAYLATLDEG
jgi:hypothetical protein